MNPSMQRGCPYWVARPTPLDDDGRMIVLAGSPAFDASAWESFAVAEVGAAAALAGLLVVAVSINLSRLLQLPAVVSRLAATLILFGGVLVAGMLLLVPGQSHVAVGVEIAVVGGLAASVLARLHGLRQSQPRYRGRTMAALGLGVLSAILVTASGLACAVGQAGGLYWLVPGVVLAFVVGLGNAWVALIEILR